MTDELNDAREALAECRNALDEQVTYVMRVWRALGIRTYEQAGGKAIDELVREAVEKGVYAEESTRLLRMARDEIVEAIGRMKEWNKAHSSLSLMAQRIDEALANPVLAVGLLREPVKAETVSNPDDLLSRVKQRRGTDQLRKLRGERPQDDPWPWIHEAELIAEVERLRLHSQGLPHAERETESGEALRFTPPAASLAPYRDGCFMQTCKEMGSCCFKGHCAVDTVLAQGSLQRAKEILADPAIDAAMKRLAGKE